MKWKFLLPALIPALLLTATSMRAGQEELRKHLLVVYNKDFDGSEKLARFYADTRDIPKDHVLGLHCSPAEQIDRDSYEKTIRDPIATYMREKGWLKLEDTSVRIGINRIDMQTASKNDIWAMVLMRGIPVKISHSQPREALEVISKEMFRTNAACIDSELATLPIELKNLSGYIQNPFFYPGYERQFDDFDAKRMILVTRLDGPSNEDVQRMIEESIRAENERLNGLVCLDARGIKDPNNGYHMGDDWLRTCASMFQQEGFTVELDDTPALFADNLPLNNVAFYSGWYADKATGFMVQPPRRFATGAIAYHIHSFSAMNVRDVNEQWVGPLIHSGACALLGSVFEPYLTLMPRADVFADYLLKGYTFAEAAYAAQPGLSWMITVIGDPLYTPFRVSLGEALMQARKGFSPLRDRLELQQFRKDMIKQKTPVSPEAITQALIYPSCTSVMWEGLADILTSLPNRPMDDIARAYRKSMSMTDVAMDQIRCGLKLERLYIAGNQPKEAIAILKTLQDKWPAEGPKFGVTDELNKLTGVPTPKPSAAPQNSNPAAQPTPQPPEPVSSPALIPPGPPKPPAPTRLH